MELLSSLRTYWKLEVSWFIGLGGLGGLVGLVGLGGLGGLQSFIIE